jgi:hypothetical protein
LQNFALKAPKRTFQRFAILNMDFCQSRFSLVSVLAVEFPE